MSPLKIAESTFRAADGLEIFYRFAASSANSKLLLLAHGLGEHSGRYPHVIEFFYNLGFNVYAPDHRGHGRSGGKRGHILRFEEYVEDLEQLRGIAAGKQAPRLTGVCGHSLGGLIAIRYVQEQAEKIDFLITSGAFLELTVKVPIYKLIPGKLLSAAAPGVAMPSGLDPATVCTDPAVVQAYINDPLVHDKVSARWFTEIVRSHEVARRQIGRLTMPILMLHGEADKLVDPRATRNYFPSLPAKKKKMVTYPGFFHEVFNEPDRARPLADIQKWLKDNGFGG